MMRLFRFLSLLLLSPANIPLVASSEKRMLEMGKKGPPARPPTKPVKPPTKPVRPPTRRPTRAPTRPVSSVMEQLKGQYQFSTGITCNTMGSLINNNLGLVSCYNSQVKFCQPSLPTALQCAVPVWTSYMNFAGKTSTAPPLPMDQQVFCLRTQPTANQTAAAKKDTGTPLFYSLCVGVGLCYQSVFPFRCFGNTTKCEGVYNSQPCSSCALSNGGRTAALKCGNYSFTLGNLAFPFGLDQPAASIPLPNFWASRI